MQVDPIARLAQDIKTVSRGPQVPVPVVPADEASFTQVEALKTTLRDQDEVRIEKIERALNLIGQVSWPPTEVVRRIAALVAAHLEKPESN